MQHVLPVQEHPYFKQLVHMVLSEFTSFYIFRFPQHTKQNFSLRSQFRFKRNLNSFPGATLQKQECPQKWCSCGHSELTCKIWYKILLLHWKEATALSSTGSLVIQLSNPSQSCWWNQALFLRYCHSMSFFTVLPIYRPVRIHPWELACQYPYPFQLQCKWTINLLDFFL